MSFSIKYGIDLYNTIDITKEILILFITKNQNLLYIPANFDFNILKGDPFPYKIKKIYIEYNNRIKTFDEYRKSDIIIHINLHIITYIKLNYNINIPHNNIPIQLNEYTCKDIIIPNKYCFKIKYGLDIYNSIDITCEILLYFFDFISHVLFIHKNINFNYLKIDPYPGKIKKLFIIIDDHIILEYDEYLKKDIYINYINHETNFKKIIIYPHREYIEEDGGINVMYNLAKLLDERNENIRIYVDSPLNIIYNKIFNKYDHYFDSENSIVIYCEGTKGNPLNAKYVIRWLLSELGKNVPYDYVNTFGKNELLYYFNYEKKFENKIYNIDTIYKLLPMLYIDSSIINKNNIRNGGTCYTMRKSNYHKSKINHIHLSLLKGNSKAFEITRNHSFSDIIEIFNNYEYFVSYDPLTFLTIISAMCGCVSILYPYDGMTKLDWLKTTVIYPYLVYKNINNLYGIAYGLEDIEWAKSTLHLVKQQWYDMDNFFKQKYLSNFIDDTNNFSKCINTVGNNFFN